MNPLIFASTSTYKQQQLSTLGLKYQAVNSQIEEFHDPALKPSTLALTLAQQKAESVMDHFSQCWVLGSDQVAVSPDNTLLTKPNTVENAVKQLSMCSGKTATFYSAICLINGTKSYKSCITTTVSFRKLTQSEIERYIAKDQPLNCAGSFKAESLGISLFEKVISEDPSALIGLPLIATCNLLRKAGFSLP
ncbi:nucleoside triphosphate pyrophosphatase [Reinekea marina]|uniref:7-methyl-GTP pyrophosphatase n=1 Tax=Reinekea marina TaxID=1310421 RepID=A0ABV7WNB3_9GAMM|nr:nucleoside triphosphate pyrophosphatase [Reinekea marina]MDN3649527.1 nucleoside triphosphate pyrophosphatase [Reinekea marina]